VASDSTISDAWAAAFAPKDRRPIYEWAADNVTLPPVLTRSGRFDVSTSRHFIAPFEAIADDRVREVNVCAPPRSGKTLLADISIPWFVDIAGASVLFVIQTEEMAKSHAELRTMPLLKSVPNIAGMMPVDRHKERNTEILFTNGLPLILCGPSISNLQNRGFRVVISDETWILAEKYPGRLEEAKSRLGDFLREENSKLLCISQGGKAGDDWHTQFNSGTFHGWEVACLGCGQYFEPRFSGQRADGSRWGILYEQEKDDADRTNLARALETIRFACPHCAHVHLDTPATKGAWNLSGRYRTDPAESQKKKSFHWGNVIDFPWTELVEKWLAARAAARLGAEVPTIQFMQKQLAEFYDPAKGGAVENLPTVTVTVAEADSGKFWASQDHIFLSVDKQLGHFWALAEAWSKSGESMVLWADRLETWQQVAEKQAEFKVPDQCVLVDCGNWQSEVWAECARHGHADKSGKWRCWWAMRGTASPAFTTQRKNKKTGKIEPVRLPYSWPADKGDPCFGLAADDPRRKELAGKTCPVVSWSNPTIKDICGSRRDAMMKGRLAFVGQGVSDHFSRHLFAEAKRPNAKDPGRYSWEVIGKRPNHLWDCYCMSAVAASMAGIITAFGSE
jgi:hypothetical protein